MRAEEIKAIESAQREKLDEVFLKKQDDWPRYTNWAGDLGVECDTYQALCRLKPELKLKPPLDLKKLFRASGMLETPNLIFMQEAGLKIAEQARAYQWREKQISGRIDAKIDVDIAPFKTSRIPLEHKALSPNSFRSCKKHRDEELPLTKSPYHWARKYPAQLAIYQLMDGSEWGEFFFYEKVTGDYFFWLLALDLEYAEELIKRAERCNANVAAATIPPAQRMAICERCDFESTHCFTGKEGGEGYELIFDQAEIEAQLKRREELEPLVKEFEELDEEIKELFHARSAIVGDFKIDSKKSGRAWLDMQALPDDIKRQFTKQLEFYRMTIQRLKK
jgi:hypothetical protein